MDKQVVVISIIRSILVTTVVLTTGFLSGCTGHHPDAGSTGTSSVISQSVEDVRDKNMAESKMMGQCMEMAKMKQKMIVDMKTKDAELTAQVAKMNKAPKQEKVALMAVVLTSIVEQRSAMHAQMEKMQGERMQHMMQHMQMGKDSMMMKCPMMTGRE